MCEHQSQNTHNTCVKISHKTLTHLSVWTLVTKHNTYVCEHQSQNTHNTCMNIGYKTLAAPKCVNIGHKTQHLSVWTSATQHLQHINCQILSVHHALRHMGAKHSGHSSSQGLYGYTVYSDTQVQNIDNTAVARDSMGTLCTQIHRYKTMTTLQWLGTLWVHIVLRYTGTKHWQHCSG